MQEYVQAEPEMNSVQMCKKAYMQKTSRQLPL